MREGEILGITGLVGSGKTELARAHLWRRPGGGGHASRWAGDRCASTRPRQAIRLGIGYLPEDRDADGLCLNLGVKENVSLVALAKLRGLFFSAAKSERTVAGLVNAIGIKAAGPVAAGQVPERRQQAEGRLRQVAHAPGAIC